MNKSFKVLLAIPLYGCAGAAFAETPDDIAARVNAQGAHVVAQALYHDKSGEWNRVLARIRKGDERWLQVALLLSPGTDGASSEELTIAISDALDTNPAGTLKIFWKTFGKGLCFFGPDERYQSSAQAKSAIERRLRIVRSVREPDVKGSKEECIKEMERSKDNQDGYYGAP